MVTFVALNAQNVNYSIVGFMDPNTYMITQEMHLGPTDTLIVYPIASNSGPETLTTSDTIFYHVSIENHSLDALGYIPAISTSAQEIAQYHLLDIDTLFPMMLGLLTTDQMDNAQYQSYFGTDFTNFEVCITLDFILHSLILLKRLSLDLMEPRQLVLLWGWIYPSFHWNYIFLLLCANKSVNFLFFFEEPYFWFRSTFIGIGTEV